MSPQPHVELQCRHLRVWQRCHAVAITVLIRHLLRVSIVPVILVATIIFSIVIAPIILLVLIIFVVRLGVCVAHVSVIALIRLIVPTHCPRWCSRMSTPLGTTAKALLHGH